MVRTGRRENRNIFTELNGPQKTEICPDRRTEKATDIDVHRSKIHFSPIDRRPTSSPVTPGRSRRRKPPPPALTGRMIVYRTDTWKLVDVWPATLVYRDLRS
jgi:hypothetical protein